MTNFSRTTKSIDQITNNSVPVESTDTIFTYLLNQMCLIYYNLV